MIVDKIIHIQIVIYKDDNNKVDDIRDNIHQLLVGHLDDICDSKVSSYEEGDDD